MPDKILAIVPDDFAWGFKLTGIDIRGCQDSQQAKEYLEKELLEQRFSLIFIDEKFILSFDARLIKKIQESASPLVMAIPLKRSFKKEVEPKDYFLKMVQDAIGYEIRIR